AVSRRRGVTRGRRGVARRVARGRRGVTRGGAGGRVGPHSPCCDRLLALEFAQRRGDLPRLAAAGELDLDLVTRLVLGEEFGEVGDGGGGGAGDREDDVALADARLGRAAASLHGTDADARGGTVVADHRGADDAQRRAVTVDHPAV